MSIARDPRKTPERGGFRRRVILELTVEELPLLEAARERHGSIREAVLQALRSADEVDGLRTRVSTLESQPPRDQQDKLAARVKRELDAASKRAGELERQLKTAKAAAAAHDKRSAAAERARQLAARLEDDLRELEEVVVDRDAELAAVYERTVDELYCARCERLAPPEEWSWRAAKGRAGVVAYHDRCGDHGPGLMGAASWLAWRAD